MDYGLTEEEKERYQRAILEIGEEKQALLKEKKVLQVGAGGLGSPLSLYLVASGIGELILFENDELSTSNLGRQVLYHRNISGKSKAKYALKLLNKLNPNVKVTIVEDWLTYDNAQPYIEGVDYLVDASDNFDTKYLINDLSLKYNIPCTIAGIQGFDGQIVSVIPHETSCYRCCFGQYKKRDQEKNVPKKLIPVLAPTCGVVGSIEANEVIKGLLNIGERILNGILMVSLKDSDFVKIPIKKNPNCICHKS